MHQVQLTTACERPLALNDNAFELCRDFLAPQGDFFYKQVSRYDDYLADIAQKPGYQAGATLMLILPFLKTAGLTNAQVAEYCRQHLTLVPKVEDAYRFLHTLNFPIFMISASYRQFAEGVAARLSFAPERLYCSELDLDRYEVAEAEAGELRRLMGEIVGAGAIELPPEARALTDLTADTQRAIELLDRIFWETIPPMKIGQIYREINTMGGPEKARALTESLAQTGLALPNLMYVGDSSTDVPAFEMVRQGGGLALSFNGNRYAVQAAEIIVVADTAWPVALLAAVFLQWGREGVVELAQSSRPGASKYLILPEAMIEPIVMGLEGSTFNLYHPATSRLSEAMADSAAMRQRLRGEAIAALG